MLLEFRVTNFRSICEEQILSLVPAAKQKEYSDNILIQGKYNALNALALYGANNSGKSNLLRAVSLLDRLVSMSSSMASTMPLPYDPFLLKEGWDSQPTRFELTFVIEEVRYRYGLSYTAEEVAHEWLYRKSVGREVPLFERVGDAIDVSAGLSAATKVLQAAIEATRPNALFLSMCDQFNITEATHLMQWFGKLIPLDGLDTSFERFNTAELLRNSDLAPILREYLTSLNLRILDVGVENHEFDESDLPSTMPKAMRRQLVRTLTGKSTQTVTATHRQYDASGHPTADTHTWDWAERESSGAIKLLETSGPIVWSLARGGVLIVDELEAKLHTQLTLQIVKFFLDPAVNTRGAQLLFASHDTNLLAYAPLRRDQICFAEKNMWEGTETYALSDLTNVPHHGSKITTDRPDVDKEKRYLEGRYGSLPALTDFRHFIAHLPAWPSLEERTNKISPSSQ